jgi:hypothetical protein
METASSFETLVMIYQTSITSQKTVKFSITPPLPSSSSSSVDISARMGYPVTELPCEASWLK